MDVQLTRDQKAFAQRAIKSGRILHEEDAVHEALQLWEERERKRLELIDMVESAEASLARGEGTYFTEETLSELAEGIKRRGRARLAAEQARQN